MNTENPYRYLFPIGCLNGILGASLWVAFRFGWVEIYPAGNHANLMIGGFLLSYATGFLWTAIPRFFQAPSPGATELALLITALGVTPVLGLLKNPAFFYLAALSGLLLTMRFGRRRFVLRKNDPPPSFVFVLAGMLFASVSLLVLALQDFFPFPDLLVACARTFFLKGFLLCLVLGIGIKLIPALLGMAPLPAASGGGTKTILEPMDLVILGAVLAGVFFESSSLLPASGFAFTAALTVAAISRIRIFVLPKTKSALSYSVWIATWVLSLSPLTLAAFPAYATHFWHLVFIGGFGLLTLFVSLRVVLAHSGQEFLRWERRPALFLLSGLVLVAALTRVSAPFLTADQMLDHYAYAAAMWIVALLGWFYFFLKFTPFFPKKSGSIREATENC